MARELGVYLHFPWCRKLCPYCDFAVMVARGEPPHEAYRDAVLAELVERAPTWQGRRLTSIYLGGGTPSLWRADCIAAAIRAIVARCGHPREVTLEANPTDCTPARLAAWRVAGIDRDLDRRAVGRPRRADHARARSPAGRWTRRGRRRDRGRACARCQADLIIGLPSARPDGRDAAPASVHALAASGAPHLSVYELTIEARTQFGKRARRGELMTLPDEGLAALYEASHHALGAAGFEHYEISSYARPGHRAIHNSLYWRGAEYLGLGAGAASFERVAGGARRATNLRHARRYLAATGTARHAEVVEQDADDVAIDLIWLAMRTSDGAALAQLDALGEPGRARLIERLQAEGLAEVTGDRLRPSLRGFLFNDRIARHVVDAAGPPIHARLTVRP